MARLGRVVGPLEALNRVIARRVLCACGKSGIGFGKRLHGGKVIGLVLIMVGAMDREAE